LSSFTTEARAAGIRPAQLRVALPVLFGVTILSSACLLFLVQPLASKLILPWFGGSAAVWITCMLFFQAGLLLGYLYAHGISQYVGAKRQGVVHSALLIISLAALPILPNAAWQPAPGEDPTWRVLGVLATSVGLPYLLLSSTSPLLQSWYAGINNRSLPYRYFALSNGGSLVALLTYPILVEPHLSGHQQAWFWSIAFALFATLCVGAAVVASVLPRQIGNDVLSIRREADAIVRARMLLWLGLAGCASTLLLTVTNLLTQNIAPMPLLWVLPLGIYLLTFILCFESDRWYKRFIFLPLMLPALGALAAGAGPLNTEQPISLELPLLSGALFVCCMACHGELARLRPGAAHLTAFYLCLSAGGALGGLLVALFAPHFFSAMYEYPIAFVCCAVLFLIVLWRQRRYWRQPKVALSLWLAGAAATVLLATYTCRETWREIKNAKLLARNFYGALRVNEFVSKNQRVRELSHGTITHGIQFVSPNLRRLPTTYYAHSSGIGLTWRVLARTGPLKIGVIGLGTGTLAAYGRVGDEFRFYEINPLIVQIARQQFSYLSDCPAHVDVVLGDARLSLAREPSQQFDILVIDAFSGDAIPVHLLTREAFSIYWRHLKPGGVLAVHVSNHYLDLSPVVLLNAKEFRKQVRQVDDDDDDAQQVFASSYDLVTSRPNFFSDPLFRGQLIHINVPSGLREWTDDYSNLWQVLKLKDDN
jgi:SAM-dependent methyltransferase